MKKNSFTYLFLALTLAGYIFISLDSPQNALIALKKSFLILKGVMPILLLVLFLTALLNTLVHPKKISKYLGEKSGIKGWFIAVSGGLFSHGSSYIWYPILQDFRLHGAKDGLIISFFYARAIKLPWLPMMISYFGLSFTLVLTLYILIASVLQGLIAERLLTPLRNPNL